jgi:hypothetical protein
MTKIVNKDQVQLIDGYFVHDGEIVSLPWAVCRQAQELDLMVQEFRYIKAQPAYSPEPSLEGFKRKSMLSELPKIDIHKIPTPTIDEAIVTSMKFMDEIDLFNDAKKVNETIERFGELVRFCDSDHVVIAQCGDVRVDTPILGNLLELSMDDVMGFISEICESPFSFTTDPDSLEDDDVDVTA